jgi:predicted DCC family thiol-disulfide oxidoreductase YuxK
MSAPAGVVLFDGVCGLCNRTVDFLLRADRRGRLRFATLQGPTAASLLGERNLPLDLQTVLYLRHRDGAAPELLDRSSAILAILRDLGGGWRAAAALRVVPRPLRDAVYRFVAARRYRWFGKRDTCRLPTPEERHRFLD